MGNDQLSIDLIDGAAAVCYVTSKELKYMMVQSWDVGVGKRVMPQAITAIESRRAPYISHYPFTVNYSPGFLSCSPQAESGIGEHRAAEDG